MTKFAAEAALTGRPICGEEADLAIGKNPWLDVLRCLAIALVLVRHGHRNWLLAGMPGLSSVDFLLLNGWIGVDLFLVLSGYLIGRNLISGYRRNRGGYLKTYMVRRALRILPAYYAVLLVTAAGVIPLYPVSQDGLAWRIGYHMLMLQDYLPSDINVVFWSLGVEAKFYLLAPIILSTMYLAYNRQCLRFVIVGFLLISPLLRWAIFSSAGAPNDYMAFWPLLRSPFHVSLEPLLLGLVLAMLEANGRLTLSARKAACILIATVVVILVWTATHDFMAQTTVFDATLQPVLIALLFAGAVAAAASLSSTPLPGTRVFAVGARLSYALYLVHLPLLPMSLVAARSLGGHVGTYWIIFLSISIAAAYVVHIIVERPFLNLRVSDENNSRFASTTANFTIRPKES